MKCPYCVAVDSKVVDSRDSETGEAIRRRRECRRCGKRFTTYERVEVPPLYVVKKDGRREEFNPRKVLGGLILASKKRDVAPSRLEAVVEAVESEIRGGNLAEVPTREVGELVMERLRAIDEIAYMRFASVYRSFKDVEDMRTTIEEMLARPPGSRPSRVRRRRHADDDDRDSRQLPLEVTPGVDGDSADRE